MNLNCYQGAAVQFHGSELRCFPLDDVWLGACPLVGAMVADEKLAQSWDNNDFDDIDDPMEAALALQHSWQGWQKTSVDVGRAVAWHYQIEYSTRKENPCHPEAASN